MKVGRRLAIKLLNASKFVLGVMGDDGRPTATRSPSRSTGRCSRRSPRSSTTRPPRSRRYDYARALERTERFFWCFCDDYVELVKGRAYGGASATRRAPRSRVALDALLRLFAPFLPFVTEEVWSWWREGSVHRAPWPDVRRPGGVRGRRRAVLPGRRRGARRGPQGEVRGQALDAHRRRPGRRARDTSERLARARARASPTCATRAGSSASSSWSRPTSSRSRSTLAPRMTPADARPARARRAWLDAHVNLETGVGVPARGGVRQAPPTLERDPSAHGPARFARARVPGGPPHRDERQDVGDPHDRGAARGGRALGRARTRARTSPRVNERMAWNGEPIADDDARRAARRAVAAVEDLLPDAPSYFEILTAAALRLVRRRRGRRRGRRGRAWAAPGTPPTSSTPTVAVVTNVSIDHVEYLGPTRAEIAAEKAGIVEPGATLVLGETDPELVPFFPAREPGRIGAARPRLRRPRRTASRIGGRVARPRTRPTRSYDDVFLAAARRAPGRQRGDRAHRGGGASSATRSAPTSSPTRSPRVASPGRLEVVGHQPLVLLDGAHNVAGAHALRAALDEEFADAAAHARRRSAAREGAARDARRARRVDAATRLVCCRRAEPACARPRGASPTPRTTSASTRARSR